MKPTPAKKTPPDLTLSEEDLAKVARMRGANSESEVDSYQMIIAEYGMLFGFAGMRAILDDLISLEEVLWQIAAAHKIQERFVYDMSRAAFVGAASAGAKNPSAAFKRLSGDILKKSKADL